MDSEKSQITVNIRIVHVAWKHRDSLFLGHAVTPRKTRYLILSLEMKCSFLFRKKGLLQNKVNENQIQNV